MEGGRSGFENYFGGNGGYAFKLSHTGWSGASFPFNAIIPVNPNSDVYKLSYDWTTECGAGGAEYSLVKLQSTLGSYNVGVKSRKVTIFGTDTDVTLSVNTKYKVDVLMDFTNHKFSACI